MGRVVEGGRGPGSGLWRTGTASGRGLLGLGAPWKKVSVLRSPSKGPTETKGTKGVAGAVFDPGFTVVGVGCRGVATFRVGKAFAGPLYFNHLRRTGAGHSGGRPEE